MEIPLEVVPETRKDTFIQKQGNFVEFAPRICVIGVGGAGGNAVNNMIRF